MTFVPASWVVVADIFRMVAGGQRVNRVRIGIWNISHKYLYHQDLKYFIYVYLSYYDLKCLIKIFVLSESYLFYTNICVIKIWNIVLCRNICETFVLTVLRGIRI